MTEQSEKAKQNQPKNPLHGVKLEDVIVKLHDKLGWEGMASEVSIRCFTHDPSVKSSLKFLRRTPWAREKVEALYIQHCAAFVWPEI